jgi:hypothetical protein
VTPHRPPRSALADLLLNAPAGPWSHRAVQRAGGPSPTTLRRAELGEGMRADSMRRLADALGLAFDVVRVAVEACARDAAPKAAPKATPKAARSAGKGSIRAWARARLRGAS